MNYAYQWFKDGIAFSTNSCINPTIAGAYTLQVQNGSCLSAISSAVNITAGSSATNQTLATWSSSGTGTFVNPNSLTTCTYTPSAADITAGNVTITLTATNAGCATVTSTKIVTIVGAATAAAVAVAAVVSPSAAASLLLALLPLLLLPCSQ